MSVPTRFFSPIPTKKYDSALISSLSSTDSYGIVPPLEDLIDLCYRCYARVETDNIDEREVLLVRQFKKYVVELHCVENLKFLIEIYKYEGLFDIIFPENDHLRLNTPSPKPSVPAMGRSVDELKKRMESKSRVSLPSPSQIVLTDSILTDSITTESITKAQVHSKAPSLISISTIDNEPASVFASQIDDLVIKEATTNIWDNLMEREINEGDEDDEDDIDFDDHHSVKEHDEYGSVLSSGLFEQQRKLQSQWELIYTKYVVKDAPEQINISDQAYKEIISENSSVASFHSPNSLLRAKNEIIQLIKENAYISFSKIIQSNETDAERCAALGISCKDDNCNIEENECLRKNESFDSQPRRISPLRGSPSYQTDALPAQKSTPASPLITPVQSNTVKSTSASKSKSLRLRSLASPVNISGSSSPSSLSAFFGHLKINTGSGSSSTTTSSSYGTTNDSGKTTPIPNSNNNNSSNSKSTNNNNNNNNSIVGRTESSTHSTTSSLSTSPILLKKSLTNDSFKEELSKYKLRLWKNKK